MKELTVYDILQMNFIKKYRIAAGEKGLKNPVNNPNVSDNPIDDLSGPDEQLASRGDFYLTSFYHVRDDDTALLRMLKWHIQMEASAICVIDQYLQDIPEEAKKLCDAHRLPVIFIDQYIPYSAIISGIIHAKLAMEQMKLAANQLFALTSARISESEKNDIIAELNPHFQNNVIAFYFMEKTERNYLPLINKFHYGISSFMVEYKNGVLFLYTFNTMSQAKLEETTEKIVADIHSRIPHALIGISDICYTSQLGKAISQACMSVSSGTLAKDHVIRFCDLGITRLLVSIENHPALDEFYQDTTAPVLAYDKETHSRLFETLAAFVENDMDYKRTGKVLYVHENTIRYRLNKIRELINFGKNEIDFYETLSIIYKIYKLKSY